jgi:hypothetical protein
MELKDMTDEELVSFFEDCIEFPTVEPDGNNVSKTRLELLSRLVRGQAAIEAMEEMINIWEEYYLENPLTRFVHVIKRYQKKVEGIK